MVDFALATNRHELLHRPTPSSSTTGFANNNANRLRADSSSMPSADPDCQHTIESHRQNEHGDVDSSCVEPPKSARWHASSIVATSLASPISHTPGQLPVACMDSSSGTDIASPVSQESDNNNGGAAVPQPRANGARSAILTGRCVSSPVPRALVAPSIPAAIEALRPTASSPSAAYPRVGGCGGCKEDVRRTGLDAAMLEHVSVDRVEQRLEELTITKQGTPLQPAPGVENTCSDGYPCLLNPDDDAALTTDAPPLASQLEPSSRGSRLLDLPQGDSIAYSPDAISGTTRSMTAINALDPSEFLREGSSQDFTHCSRVSAVKYNERAVTLDGNAPLSSHAGAHIYGTLNVQMQFSDNDMSALQTDSSDTHLMLGRDEHFMEETIGNAQVPVDVTQESSVAVSAPSQVRRHTTSVATQWSPRSESKVHQRPKYDMSVDSLLAIIEAYSMREQILTKDVEDSKKLLEHERSIFEEQIARLRTDLDERNDKSLEWQALYRMLQHQKKVPYTRQ
eukprot:GEMP01028202.1.p1 GENE.GEMP01028202.1~~GEMP01028202.1.p1  ORF type:complete len:530 (+),score=83.68 GEMP01028202.1:59-1591(+)